MLEVQLEGLKKTTTACFICRLHIPTTDVPVLHEHSYRDMNLLSYKHLVELLHRLFRSMGKWKQKQSERWYPFAVRPCSPHWDTVPPQNTLRVPPGYKGHTPWHFSQIVASASPRWSKLAPLIEVSRSNIKTRLSWCIHQQCNQQRHIHEPITGFFTHEDGTARLPRNVGKESPLLAAC